MTAKTIAYLSVSTGDQDGQTNKCDILQLSNTTGIGPVVASFWLLV